MRMKKGSVERRPICRAGKRQGGWGRSWGKRFNSECISEVTWMGFVDGFDVGSETKEWRMASGCWPDSGKMKGTFTEKWEIYRRARAGVKEVRNSALDISRLWGSTCIRVVMLNVIGQLGVWSEKRPGLEDGSLLEDVSLDITGISMVRLDQVPGE